MSTLGIILVQCVSDKDTSGNITVGDVYEMKTYSSQAWWSLPVVGIIDDSGLYTVYPASYFKQVNVEYGGDVD